MGWGMCLSLLQAWLQGPAGRPLSCRSELQHKLHLAWGSGGACARRECPRVPCSHLAARGAALGSAWVLWAPWGAGCVCGAERSLARAGCRCCVCMDMYVRAGVTPVQSQLHGLVCISLCIELCVFVCRVVCASACDSVPCTATFPYTCVFPRRGVCSQ